MKRINHFRTKRANKKEVFVAVLKSRRDLRILLRELWYRIPISFFPKRAFTHVAFYQPQTGFGKSGKCIRYYACIAKREVKKRIELLPRESGHLRAYEDYIKISFKNIEQLAKPIRNVVPRRVSFGFTSLKNLRSARDVLELYGVPPTEQILERRLSELGVKTLPQHTLSVGGKRYRLDLAIFCRDGNIAVECDNLKAHSSNVQKLKDEKKDAALRRRGWRVIRLSEDDILLRLDRSVTRISKMFRALGGTGI